MRLLVRGETIGQLEKNVASKEKGGWHRITENKMDDSLSSYGVIEWVCVMEMAKHEGKRRWGDGKGKKSGAGN
jgi:hypothetical protein